MSPRKPVLSSYFQQERQIEEWNQGHQPIDDRQLDVKIAQTRTELESTKEEVENTTKWCQTAETLDEFLNKTPEAQLREAFEKRAQDWNEQKADLERDVRSLALDNSRLQKENERLKSDDREKQRTLETERAETAKEISRWREQAEGMVNQWMSLVDHTLGRAFEKLSFAHEEGDKWLEEPSIEYLGKRHDELATLISGLDKIIDRANEKYNVANAGCADLIQKVAEDRTRLHRQKLALQKSKVEMEKALKFIKTSQAEDS